MLIKFWASDVGVFFLRFSLNINKRMDYRGFAASAKWCIFLIKYSESVMQKRLKYMCDVFASELRNKPNTITTVIYYFMFMSKNYMRAIILISYILIRGLLGILSIMFS